MNRQVSASTTPTSGRQATRSHLCCTLSPIVNYRKFSNIRRTKSQDLNFSRLGLQLSLRNTVEAKRLAENEDVVGATPTGDAPTTSEWSTI